MWKIKSEPEPSRSNHFWLPAKTAYSTYLPLPSVLRGNLPYPKSKNLLCHSDKETTFEHMYKFREIIFLNVYWLQLNPITVTKVNSLEIIFFNFWISQMLLIISLFWESKHYGVFTMHLIWLHWQCSKTDENILT